MGKAAVKSIRLGVLVPPLVKFLPTSMYRYFVIGFVLPLILHSNWRIRGTLNIMGLGRTLSLMLHDSPRDAGSVLCQLQLILKRVDSMSGVLARVLIFR